MTATREEHLQAAGKARGLTDPDLLKLADSTLGPTEAVLDLARRFPGAFGSTAPNVRGMPLKDYRAAKADLLANNTRREAQEAQARATERTIHNAESRRRGSVS